MEIKHQGEWYMRYLVFALLIVVASSANAQKPTPYREPPNYAQLRNDCVDDSDATRQIAGCEAILANPTETANHPVALNNRGAARERNGNFAAALADFDQAIQRDPSFVLARVNRGRVLGRLGRTDEAIAWLDRTIALGDDGLARLERGRLRASRNDPGAMTDFDAAARLMPADLEVRQARDWARLRVLQGLAFDGLAPPATTLAEAVLSAEGFLGPMTREDAAGLRRNGPNRVSASWATMPQGGTPGHYEVEVRSCSEVIYSEIEDELGPRPYERRVINLDRLRSLLRRDGDTFTYTAGVYGERGAERRRRGGRALAHDPPGDSQSICRVRCARFR